MDSNRISSGSSAFLIKDDELKKGWYSNFIAFLEKEGFNSWGRKGHFPGINWIYVNLNSKIYAFGIPGVGLTIPVGNHAITKSEFVQIYNIYKKYDTNHPLKMLD